MGDNTKIEWADASWNPVTGCTKVSAGCDHCYAETMATRFAGTKAYPNGFQVTLRPERLDQPLRWTRPRRIFVNSMSDLFHDQVPTEYIAQVFAIMAAARQHTFQVLTKRPGRMRSLLNSFEFWQIVRREANTLGHPDALDYSVQFGPLPNVWLGVSVENQQWADVRIPQLLATPAAVRFLSMEPLLGAVDLDQPRCADHDRLEVSTLPDGTECCVPCAADGFSGELSYGHWLGSDGIDWVIVGGESGPHARPMHPAWVLSLRDQCQTAGVPFLLKQWGEWRWAREADDHEYELLHGDKFPQEWHSLDLDGRLHSGPPAVDSATVQRVGKKAAGRELDGRTWDEYPEVQS